MPGMIASVSTSLAETLPLALAIAASPLTIVPAILLLFADRPRATSAAFLVGWIAGVAAATTVAVLLASIIEGWEDSPRWTGWVRLVAGVGLVVLAVRQWHGRHAPKPPPAWFDAIAGAEPARAFRLGIILAVANPKVLVLCVVAGLTIGGYDETSSATVLALIAFTLVASASVALPLVLFTVIGDRMLGSLGRARDWLLANNAVVMSTVLLAIGVVVLLEGLRVLI